MGVGKTTVSRQLQKLLPDNVFLDGDNCWDSTPFICNEYTKTMVIDNISHLLNSFLACPDFNNVIFCWVLHKKEIADEILSRLTLPYTFYHFTLTADEKVLTDRLKADVNQRDEGIILRAKDRQNSAKKLKTIQIDTTNLSPREVAETILKTINIQGE